MRGDKFILRAGLGVKGDILITLMICLVEFGLHLADLLAVADDCNISRKGNIEHEELESDMGIGDGLEALRIPVGVHLLGLGAVPILDVVVKVLKGVLEPIFEDIGVPVIGAPFLSVYDVDEYLQFGFVGIVLDDFDYFCFRNVFVFDGKAALDALVHFLSHEVKPLDLWDQFNQLLLQLDLFSLYQKLFDFLRISYPLAGLELVL